MYFTYMKKYEYMTNLGFFLKDKIRHRHVISIIILIFLNTLGFGLFDIQNKVLALNLHVFKLLFKLHKI